MVRKLPSGRTLTSISLLAMVLLCSGCESQLGVKIGDTPPGISGTDIHGDYVSLSQLKGKVVVIYFWEDSCCGGSLKRLEPFYRQSKDKGLQILAINELGSKREVASYASNNALTFTMLTDEYSMLFKIYRVIGFPTIFILDRNGIVREKIMGDIQSAKLEQLTSIYLDNKTPQK
jgi:cytochrome c biogenesis protein CcmG, thiol:disulfide interchange protein DsbE